MRRMIKGKAARHSYFVDRIIMTIFFKHLIARNDQTRKKNFQFRNRFYLKVLNHYL